MNRTKLTRKQKVQIQQEKKRIEQAKLKYKVGIWSIVLGTCFFLFFGSLWSSRNDKIEKDELKIVSGNVIGQLEKKWKKTVGNSIEIYLDEYPNTKFKVGRFGSNSVDIDLLNERIENQNGIDIQILESDWDKVDIKQTISVYGLLKNKTEFLSVNTYNHLRKKDRNSIFAYALILWSVMMIGYGVILVIQNRIPADNKR